jgi:superfamily II DNA or RNA helicase
MTTYFSSKYRFLAYPLATDGGLYTAQAGAIHQIASHFSLHDEPAVITMPTGSGKTAVLMMAPFVLQATRVLVVTPSRLVREQIADDFGKLETLRKAGVLPSDIAKPTVHELKRRVNTDEGWQALRSFDVVVSTTNCASPGHLDIPSPPGELFDLVLIDEAHHSPAPTWQKLLDSFPNAKRVLFTATPFRRDRQEIRGLFAYSYPIAKAFEDKIFGHIRYVPVSDAADGPANDLAIARTTQGLFNSDKAAGLRHFVMVRTDSVPRAMGLTRLYQENTSLRLTMVTSKMSQTKVAGVLSQLRAGELDGVICVNMMGEGFNFPNLKIAAIHSPHKSLEVTLQFIGRFARTNSPDIGEAKFVAVTSDLEIEGRKFFDEDAVWHKIIIDLSRSKIEEEVALREELEQFVSLEQVEEADDLSLYSLYPRSHVKIYEIATEAVLPNSIQLPTGLESVYQGVNDRRDTFVLITRTSDIPGWSTTNRFIDVEHELYVVVVDRQNSLLFINASHSSESMYGALASQVAHELKPVPTSLVKRVLKDLVNQKAFSVGMRNILANATESYRTMSGPRADGKVTASDGRLYRLGHAFTSGETADGQKSTIGYSTRSKVWGTEHLQIPGLAEWCRKIGAKIRSTGPVVTNSGLDNLSTGEVVTSLPIDIVFAQWDGEVYDPNSQVHLRYTNADGDQQRVHVSDAEIVVDRNSSSAEKIVFLVHAPGKSWRCGFTLTELFASDDDVQVEIGPTRTDFASFLNEHPVNFFTASGHFLFSNEIHKPSTHFEPINPQQIVTRDWRADGTNIELEVSVGDSTSIHEATEAIARAEAPELLICDHGTNEIADFISLSRRDRTLRVQLFHCKKSSEAKPGARVKDIYEVMGQGQKSVLWRDLDRIVRRLRARPGATYVVGTPQTLVDLGKAGKSMFFEMEVVVVQPGISKAALHQSHQEMLGATNDYIVNGGCLPLRVLASD